MGRDSPQLPRRQVVDHPVPFGLTAVFANVLLNQLGLPVPVIPTLILAGAFAYDGRLSAAGLRRRRDCGLRDRRYGVVPVGALVRQPGDETVVSDFPHSGLLRRVRPQTRFERWGANALIAAKFVPGLSVGRSAPGGRYPHELRAIHRLLRPRLGRCGSAFCRRCGLFLGPQSIGCCRTCARLAALHCWSSPRCIALYIAYKWWQRRRFFAFLRMARITVGELYRLLDSGAAPRDRRRAIADGTLARAAANSRRIARPGGGYGAHIKELPRDHEIVLVLHVPERGLGGQSGEDADELRVPARAPVARRTGCLDCCGLCS